MPHRAAIFADFLAFTSGISSIAAWQEQLDWTLRILAAIVAIAAGGLAIWQRLQHRRTARRDREGD